METPSAVRPPINAETLPTPSESDPNKQPQPEAINTHSIDIPPPPFVNSINELRSLSTALSAFLRRYDDLHDHLNFINTSIDAKLPNHLLTTTNPSQPTLIPLPESSAHTVASVSKTRVPEQNPNGTASNCERSLEHLRKPEIPDFSKKPGETGVSKNPEESDTFEEPEETDTFEEPEETGTFEEPEETGISEEPEETDMLENPEETDASKKSEETQVSKKHEETDTLKKPVLSELESFCERMSGRDIKKYVIAHISDKPKLLQEIPKALKFAKDPAKLVLQSIGRFFVQGSKAFGKGSMLNLARMASVMILEGFVMISSDGIEIAKEEEESAAKAAIDWRKRIITEGALARACQADARGLLMLISGFGIPSVFKNKDIRDLIRASDVNEISTALRRSIILIPKIPEVIDWMVKNNLEIEAVDLAYALGLEDKCPPQTILTTFFRNKIKDIQHDSSSQAKEEIKKQLSDLNSIRKCLQSHNINPLKLVPDYKIDEKIQQLQDHIIKLDSKPSKEKPTQKRKTKEHESSRNPKHQEPKRTRLTSLDNIPQEHEPVHRYSSFISPYSSSSTLHRPGLPEPITSPLAVNGSGGLARGSYGAGVYREPITSPVAIDGSGGLTRGSYGTGLYRGTASDHMANGRSYNWDQDSDLIEKYLGQGYSGRVQAYDPQGPSSTAGMIGSYARPSGSSLESFPGLPNSGPSVGVSGRAGPGSDLYGFADTVVENGSYRGSRASGSGTVRSSYLY